MKEEKTYCFFKKINILHNIFVMKLQILNRLLLVSKSYNFHAKYFYNERLSHKFRIEEKAKTFFRKHQIECEFAAAIRGSFARGDCTKFSDLDLLIISDAPKCNSYIKKRLNQSTLKEVLNIELSITQIPELLPYSICDNIFFLTSISQVKFLEGSRKIYNNFLASLYKQLIKIPLHYLFYLYENDSFRQFEINNYKRDPYIALHKNPGGIIDYDFLTLLTLILNLKKESSKKKIYGRLMQSQMCYDYLSNLKSYLVSPISKNRDSLCNEKHKICRIATKNPWYFEPIFAINFLNTHYKVLRDFIQDLKK